MALSARLPTIEGVIDRRILVNYRVRPDVLERIVPAPFRPKLVAGWGVAGICLIRLKQIRPMHAPAWIGVGSENAAHRIAVEWDDGGARREGVYVPRRDTSSRLNALLGGRVFPGDQHHARYDVAEHDDDYRIAVRSDDGAVALAVEGRLAPALPPTSVFGDLAAASRFFEAGAMGYSATGTAGRYDGLELRSFAWRVAPLDVRAVRSSFFDDATRFPAGSVTFDCALLMRDIRHAWQALEPLCAPCAA